MTKSKEGKKSSKKDSSNSSTTTSSNVQGTSKIKLSRSQFLSSVPSSTLSDPIHAQYFQLLCDRLGKTVSVEATPEKGGKGLFARTDIEEGNVLFLETPLGTLQHSSNLAQLCEYCKCFIGTLEYQLQPLLSVNLNSSQRASLDKDTAHELEQSFKIDTVSSALPLLSTFSSVPSSTSSSSADPSSNTSPTKFTLPVVDDTFLTDIFYCQAGCGDQYCSKVCRDTAWRKYHAILCTGPNDEESSPSATTEQSNINTSSSSNISNIHNHHHHGHSHDHSHHHHHDEHCHHDHEEDHSSTDEENDGEDEIHDETNINIAALFRQQALATNEIFLLAGRMICRILEAWIRNGNDIQKALLPFKVLHSEPWTLIFAKQQLGTKYFTNTNTNDKKHIQNNTENIDEEYDQEQYILETQQQIQEWVRDSATILRQLVEQRLPAYVELIENTPIPNTASETTNKSTDTTTNTTPSLSIPSSKSSRRTLSTDELQLLFNPDNYELLIGAFELNNIEMKIDSPLRDYMSVITSLPQTIPPNSTATQSPYHAAISILSPYLRQIVQADKKRKDLTQAVRAFTGEDEEMEDDDEDLDDDEAGISENPGAKHHHKHDHENDDDDENDDDYVDDEDDDEDDDEYDDENDEEDDDEDDEEGVSYIDLPADQYGGPLRVPLRLFPIASGTALFAIQCCANHSCDPNVQLCYINGNCTGAFMALENLKAGDELFINYVDIEQEVEDRQDELAHYGFLCACPKCKDEMRSKKLQLKKWSKTV